MVNISKYGSPKAIHRANIVFTGPRRRLVKLMKLYSEIPNQSKH